MAKDESRWPIPTPSTWFAERVVDKNKSRGNRFLEWCGVSHVLSPKHLHFLFLIFLFVFFIDELMLIAAVLGGPIAALAVLFWGLVVFGIRETEWGQRRWRGAKSRLTPGTGRGGRHKLRRRK